MADRYFVERPIEGLSARLVGGEAHHLAHVMRAKPGDEVTLFDGSGAEFSARIKQAGRAEIELVVVARFEVDRELALQITLGTALPKGDRARWLVEKATELGVAKLVPLVTERSNERPTAAALEKLRRAVIEASKQCGRNSLMEVAEPVAFAEFAAGNQSAIRLIAHPGGGTLQHSVEKRTGAEAALAVGPEGGFTAAEVEAALASGWSAIDLGARLLRVETAALALTAMVVDRSLARAES
jgi:16S rRNA (uracil1498-N3)-methyltransferase